MDVVYFVGFDGTPQPSTVSVVVWRPRSTGLGLAQGVLARTEDHSRSHLCESHRLDHTHTGDRSEIRISDDLAIVTKLDCAETQMRLVIIVRANRRVGPSRDHAPMAERARAGLAGPSAATADEFLLFPHPPAPRHMVEQMGEGESHERRRAVAPTLR